MRKRSANGRSAIITRCVPPSRSVTARVTSGTSRESSTSGCARRRRGFDRKRRRWPLRQLTPPDLAIPREGLYRQLVRREVDRLAKQGGVEKFVLCHCGSPQRGESGIHIH